mmetsp:Transcript_31413/g.66529  ORF Transcript_31413/g.66529 Transcript_31413/m.66529 type:complete len:202 (-) Transcript_31413:18-623(-)
MAPSWACWSSSMTASSPPNSASMASRETRWLGLARRVDSWMTIWPSMTWTWGPVGVLSSSLLVVGAAMAGLVSLSSSSNKASYLLSLLFCLLSPLLVAASLEASLDASPSLVASPPLVVDVSFSSSPFFDDDNELYFSISISAAGLSVESSSSSSSPSTPGSFFFFFFFFSSTSEVDGEDDDDDEEDDPPPTVSPTGSNVL